MDEANREEKASDSLTKGKFEALDSQASFDRVLFDGGEFGTGGEVGSEEEDFLGIPGLLDAEQVRTLLRQRQHEQLKASAEQARAQEPQIAPHELHRQPSQGAQRPGRRLEPPHRAAPRRHPRRAPPGLWRPGHRAGLRRADPGADRQDPPMGHPAVPLEPVR